MNMTNPNFRETDSYSALILRAKNAEKRAEAAEKENTKIIEQNKEFQRLLQPFKADYFQNLSAEEIAALAKVSISLKAQNRNMQNAFIDLTEYFNRANETKTFDDYKLAILKGLEACRKFNPFIEAVGERKNDE